MKISMRVRVLSVLLLSIVTSILVYNNRSAWAEQVGSSPESGTSSRIKTIYDSLSSLSHLFLMDQTLQEYGETGV